MSQSNSLRLRRIKAVLRPLPAILCLLLPTLQPLGPPTLSADIPAPQLDPGILNFPDIQPAQKPKSAAWRLSLLPVGVQKNPTVDYAIITEMTPAGRKLPEPSHAKPVYYLAHSMGQTSIGDPYATMKDIPYSYLEKLLNTALASNGYRPCDNDNPPTQILFFTWGMLNDKDFGGNNDIDNLKNVDDIGKDIGDLANDDTIPVQYDPELLLSRATVVGGRKFAGEFARMLVEQVEWQYIPAGMLPAGMLPAPAIGSPLRRFSERDTLTETLVYAILRECYYLVVISLDADALMHNERKLLWTTHITTISKGIVFAQTLPIMINNAAYYFGRDMKQPEIVTKRAYKKATVELGEMTVVDDNTSRSANPSPTGTTATSGTTTGNP